MSRRLYDKLLQENITKHYKLDPEGLYEVINSEAKTCTIANRLGLDGRMEIGKNEAFLTLNDHKDSFTEATPAG